MLKETRQGSVKGFVAGKETGEGQNSFSSEFLDNYDIYTNIRETAQEDQTDCTYDDPERR